MACSQIFLFSLIHRSLSSAQAITPGSGKHVTSPATSNKAGRPSHISHNKHARITFLAGFAYSSGTHLHANALCNNHNHPVGIAVIIVVEQEQAQAEGKAEVEATVRDEEEAAAGPDAPADSKVSSTASGTATALRDYRRKDSASRRRVRTREDTFTRASRRTNAAFSCGRKKLRSARPRVS